MKEFKTKAFKIALDGLNIIFTVITLALLFIAIFKPDLVKLFLDWMSKLILSLWYWNYLIAFSSAMIESFPVIWVLVPWMQIMLMVWWFFLVWWAYGKFAMFEVILLAIIWAIIWNYVGYLLGIKYGDSFFKRYWYLFWLWKTELKILKKQIDKNWAAFIIFGKFHNLTRAFIPFIAGSMWMHKKRFWPYNIIWSVIWAITIIVLWVVFANYYKIIVDHTLYIMLGIALLVGLYIYFFKRKEFKQYIVDKNVEIEEQVNSK